MTDSRDSRGKDDRVVYEQTVEAMFQCALKGRVTPRLKQRLLGLGIDVDHKLRSTYARRAWIAALRATVEELYPDAPKERAFFELGEQLIHSFHETMMGAALESVLKVIGPKQALLRLTHSFQYANNFADSKVTELGPGEFELWVNEAEVSPDFVAGTVSAMLHVAGAQDPKLEILDFDGHACRYRIKL